MTMDDIELAGAAMNLLQHMQMRRDPVGDRSVQAHGARPIRFPICAGLRITAGKQRDVMPQCDEFFREEGYDTLGAAIEFRGNSLEQRRNLSNAHVVELPRFNE